MRVFAGFDRALNSRNLGHFFFPILDFDSSRPTPADPYSSTDIYVLFLCGVKHTHFKMGEEAPRRMEDIFGSDSSDDESPPPVAATPESASKEKAITGGSESDSDDDDVIVRKSALKNDIADSNPEDSDDDDIPVKRSRLKKAKSSTDESDSQDRSLSPKKKSRLRRSKSTDSDDDDDDENLSPSDKSKLRQKIERRDSESSSDSSDDDSDEKVMKRKRDRNKEDSRKNKKRRKDDSTAYGAEAVVARTVDDDNFIDNDDDDADIVAEYNQQRQNFIDEHDAEFEDSGRKKNGGYDSDEDDSHLNAVDRAQRAIKKRRQKKKVVHTEEEMEEIAKRILYRLEETADNDLTEVKASRPGTHKIKALKWALAAIGRKENQETLLSFNLCGVLEKWLSPLPDGSLPSLDVRTRLYKLIRKLPISKEHLTNSGLGKVTMALFHHKKETKANKVILKALIEQWMRPVFQKSDTYKDIMRNVAVVDSENLSYIKERRAKKHKKSDLRLTLTKNKVLTPKDKGFRWHPERQPQMILDFKRRPAAKKILERGRHYGKSDKQMGIERRLNKMRRAQKKDPTKVRMTGMSIEGRKCK